jgi:Ser/Thr protein kinase RdoA (MazF antagonist)
LWFCESPNVEIIHKAVVAGVRHPRILQTTSGDNLFEGCGVQLVVLEFIEGKTFYDLGGPLSDAELEMVVAEAAKINQIDYSPPYLFDSWAIPNVEKMYDKVRGLLSPGDLSLADEALARFKNIPLDKLPKAFVHGDLIQTNVLKGDDGNIYVLDFSVANIYPRIQELAVMASSLLTEMSLQQKLQKLTEMYSRHNPLTDIEREHLYNYALAGSAMELLGGHQEKYINHVDNQETEYWINTGRNGLKEGELV